MRADIHDGQERERSTQGPDTEAQDQQSSDRHFWLATHGRSIQMCQSRAFAGYATPLKSLPLISPRQYWHPHQHYDCWLRRLHTLNAFTGRLKPLRASSPANSTSTSVSTALNTLISTRICPSLA